MTSCCWSSRRRAWGWNSSGEKTTNFRLTPVQKALSQNDGSREAPRASGETAAFPGSLVLDNRSRMRFCVFSNQPLGDGFREGNMRRNWGLRPSSLVFSPLLSDARRGTPQPDEPLNRPAPVSPPISTDLRVFLRPRRL
jgi:hypothetical protein